MSADQKIARAAKKPPLALIPFVYLWGAARVFAYGVKKYALGNWHRATLDDGAGERYVSATTRHLAAMQNPDGTWSPESLAALDDESGLPHLDHAICSLIMLRGIMVKCGALPADPGEGKEPPKTRTDGWTNVLTGIGIGPLPKGPHTHDSINEHYAKRAAEIGVPAHIAHAPCDTYYCQQEGHLEEIEKIVRRVSPQPRVFRMDCDIAVAERLVQQGKLRREAGGYALPFTETEVPA